MSKIIVIFLILLSGGFVFGQCSAPVVVNNNYKHVAVNTEGYFVSEIVAPIAVPVLIPSTMFQYLPAFQPSTGIPVGGVPVNGGQVNGSPVNGTPVTNAAPLNAQSTVSTADIERIINEKVEAILRRRFQPSHREDKGPPVLILPAEFAKLKQKETQEIKKPKLPTGDINQQTATLLGSKSCVRCHTAGSEQPVKGNVTLFTKKDNQLYFQPSVSKKQILAAVTPDQSGKAAMPPSGAGLSENERKVLQQWATKP